MNAPQNINIPSIGAVQPENLPQEFEATNSFLRWGYVRDHKDPNKIKKSPMNEAGKCCGYSDECAWLSLHEAKLAVLDKDLGLGISLGEQGLKLSIGGREGYLYCLDFDGFAGLGGKLVDNGVMKFLERSPSYTEMSPSTTGFKQFFITDKKPTTKFKIKFGPSEFAEDYPDVRKYKHREVEVFSKGFFMALTGSVFHADFGELKFIPADELDEIFDSLDEWAKGTGGAGRDKQPAVSSPTNDIATGYSELKPDSLKLVLGFIDNTDEQAWTDVANALARVYGETGRSYFDRFSEGEYSGNSFNKYSSSEVDSRYDRALRDLNKRQNGYGVNHLIKLAETNPTWNSPKLEYEELSFNWAYESKESPGSQTASSIAAKQSSPKKNAAQKAKKKGKLKSPRKRSNPENFNHADIANAKLFAEQHRNRLLYVDDVGYWLKFTVKRGWTRAKPGAEVRAAKRVIKQIAKAAGHAFKKDPNSPHTKALMSEVKRSSKAPAVKAMIDLAKSEPGMTVTVNQLDANNWQVGVKNGVLDLKSGKLLPFTPNLLVSKRCNVKFDPLAKCPRFEQFLKEVIPDEKQRKFIVRWMGYLLTGETGEQKFVFLHGSGRNGKSVFVELLDWMLGNYSRKLQTEMLMRQNRSPQGPSPDIVSLHGMRLVYCNETAEGGWLDDAKVKEMTGQDTLSGRAPYAKESIEFQPTHKLIMAGNHVPNVADTSLGFWRRVILFPFNQTIPEGDIDRHLLQKLQGEGAGILNLILSGLRSWLKSGLKEPESLQRATNAYKNDQDVVEEWLRDRCELGNGFSAKKRDLYTGYRNWCTDNGHRALGSGRFSHRLTAKGYKAESDNRTINGLKLADSSDGIRRGAY